MPGAPLLPPLLPSASPLLLLPPSAAAAPPLPALLPAPLPQLLLASGCCSALPWVAAGASCAGGGGPWQRSACHCMRRSTGLTSTMLTRSACIQRGQHACQWSASKTSLLPPAGMQAHPTPGGPQPARSRTWENCWKAAVPRSRSAISVPAGGGHRGCTAPSAGCGGKHGTCLPGLDGTAAGQWRWPAAGSLWPQSGAGQVCGPIPHPAFTSAGPQLHQVQLRRAAQLLPGRHAPDANHLQAAAAGGG